MNFYFSSSFNEKDNTKVNFKNELPHILFDNKSIILKSLRIHNTPSLLKNEKISHFKSSISDTSRVNSNIWKREEGYHIVINPFKLTLTIKKNTNTTGENDNKLSLKTSHISYDINFPKKTYKSSLKFVKDLNNLFKENKISLKFEINHKKITVNTKYNQIKFQCTDKSLLKKLGISSFERNAIKLKPYMKIKNKINFTLTQTNYFFINFNEIRSIKDLVIAYNELINALDKKEIYKEVFYLKDNYIQISPFNLEKLTMINYRVIANIIKINKSNINVSNDGFFEILSTNKYEVKKTNVPKLIKIFSPNVYNSFTEASNVGGLIGLFPYKKEEDYHHEIINNFSVQLYKGIHENIKFVLCDENNEKINLSSGTETLIHCQIIESIMPSNKILYFNSEDKKSKELYPENTQSDFSQLIDGELNCSDGNHLVALQSLYLPSKINNLPSQNFNFSVHAYTDIYLVSKHELEEFPVKYYNEESFFQELRNKFKKYGCDFYIEEDRYRLQLMHTSEYKKIQITLPPQIAYVLGVSNTVLDKNSKLFLFKDVLYKRYIYKFPFVNRFNIIRSKMVKLTCNFVENSYFGSDLTQLLHTINLDETYYNNQENGAFINITEKIFLKVNKNTYNNIRFQLLDQYDKKVKFDSNESVEGILVFIGE